MLALIIIISILLLILLSLNNGNKNSNSYELDQKLIKNGTKIKCPYCSEAIFSDAKVCNKCFRDILPPEDVRNREKLESFAFLSDVGNFPFTNKWLIEEFYINSKNIQLLHASAIKNFPDFKHINEDNLEFLLKLQNVDI